MSQRTVPTPDEIWSLLKEVSKSQKETGRQIEVLSAKTDRQIEATARQIEATDKQLKEQLRETDKQLKKTDALFNSRWGKLVESLVEASYLPLPALG